MIDISVIVPIYNVEKYIERCLRSLFCQTKVDGVEFLLVNDCSTDKSMYIAQKIISEFSNLNVTILNNKVNQGSSATRHFGLFMAKGRYTIQIDSDDWCEQTMLEELYTQAQKHNADIVQFDHISYFKHQSIYFDNTLPQNKIELLEEVLYKAKCHNVWSKFIKRELFNNGDTFFYQGINMGEDYLASCKLFHYSQKTICVPKAYVHHDCTNYSSLTKSKRTISKAQQRYKCLCLISDFLIEKGYCLPPKERDRDDRLMTKYMLLFLSQRDQQKQYSKIWPELNDKVFDSNIRLRYKIVLYLANNGYLVLCNILFSLIRLLK